MLAYTIDARRTSSTRAVARCKDATIDLDTALAGSTSAFNPAELLLAAVAACMLKGIERMVPMLHFDVRGAEVRVRGVRQDRPPKLVAISYELTVDTSESDARLELLHQNLRKFGTIYNTVAAGVALEGVIRRAPVAARPSAIPDDVAIT
ncbi:MAG: OsmC family protein [Gemmatirosa sp.]